MKKYANYKDSGADWIGAIPQEWNVKRLKYSTYYNRVTLTEQTNPDFQLEYIDIGSVDREGNILCTESYKFSEAPSRARRIVSAGDTLISTVRTYLKAIAYIADPSANLVCSTGFAVISPDEFQMDVKYLFYLCRSEHFVEQIMALSKGVSYPAIDSFDLRSIHLALPPLLHQFKIAEYLDQRTKRINQIIEKKKRLIELLREERRSIITQAVTRGLDESAKLKPSGIPWLGDLPEHWETRPLKYLVSVKARLGWRGLKADEYVPEGYGFLSTPNIKTDDIDFENINYITEERYLESHEIILEEGDVLLAKDGSTLGTVNIIKHLPFPSTVNSSIAILRVLKKQDLDPMFLKICIGADFIQNTIKMIKDGMGVPHLFQADIREFPLVIPPIGEQQTIGNHLTIKCGEIDATIRKIDKEIGLIKEYRTALISEVVTGKIKVV